MMSINSIFEEHLSRKFNGCIYEMLRSDDLGEFLYNMSLAGFDLHDDIEYIKINDEDFLREKHPDKVYVSHVDHYLYKALKSLASNPSRMDFLVDYVLRSKVLSQDSYINRILFHTARGVLRKEDGSLRNPVDFGRKLIGKKFLEILLESSFKNKDIESIKHLRSFPSAKNILTDEYLDKFIRSKSGSKDYDYIQVYFNELLIKVSKEDMTLQGYWESLEEKNIFNKKSTFDSIRLNFDKNIIGKFPDAFVDKVLRMPRINLSRGNEFILIMIEHGFDCYPGYIMGYEGNFSYFDKKGKSRNYQSMIDVCLKNGSLPGYKALLNCIPLDEIKIHKRCAQVLNIIHEMTGRHDVLPYMKLKDRGLALDADLGL